VRVRLLHSPQTSGARNMAIDEALLIHKTPTLRFYSWDPPCVSIGYFQSAQREVDEASCRSYGVGIVRRPTGGKAVLHEHELTYSLVLPENSVGENVISSYKTISRAFVGALRSLGIPVEVRTGAEPRGHSPLCFQAVSYYELVLHGKKIMGSAQSRQNGMLLQHGSLLLDVDYTKLFACLRFGHAARRASDLEGFVTGINRECGRQLTAAGLSQKITACARRELGFSFYRAGLSPDEGRTAHSLEKEKYENPTWTFKTAFARN
jgi:lipoyl(octanoyl) transferase